MARHTNRLGLTAPTDPPIDIATDEVAARYEEFHRLYAELAVAHSDLQQHKRSRDAATQKDAREAGDARRQGKPLTTQQPNVKRYRQELEAKQHAEASLRYASGESSKELVQTVEDARDELSAQITEAIEASESAFADSIGVLERAHTTMAEAHSAARWLRAFPSSYKGPAGCSVPLKGVNESEYSFASVVAALRAILVKPEPEPERMQLHESGASIPA